MARARCPRSSVEAGQKSVQIERSMKEAFFSSLENGCHLASTLKLEEREFVVDSGASMHMISKKDLSNAEMDSLTLKTKIAMSVTGPKLQGPHAEDAMAKPHLLMTADHKNLAKKTSLPSTRNKEERLRKKRKNFATHGLWSVREFAEIRSNNSVRQRILTTTEGTCSTLSLPKQR